MKEQSYTKDIIRQDIKKIVLVFKHRHFPFFICFKPYVYVCS